MNESRIMERSDNVVHCQYASQRHSWIHAVQNAAKRAGERRGRHAIRPKHDSHRVGGTPQLRVRYGEHGKENGLGRRIGKRRAANVVGYADDTIEWGRAAISPDSFPHRILPRPQSLCERFRHNDSARASFNVAPARLSSAHFDAQCSEVAWRDEVGPDTSCTLSSIHARILDRDA